MLKSIPSAVAKNVIINDIKIETASISIVIPKGRVNEVISSGMPIFSVAHFNEMGIVALLEQVPNAFRSYRCDILKNLTIPP